MPVNVLVPVILSSVAAVNLLTSILNDAAFVELVQPSNPLFPNLVTFFGFGISITLEPDGAFKYIVRNAPAVTVHVILSPVVPPESV